MNILVTGSTGFIGRSLCEKLTEKNLKAWGTVLAGESVESLPANVEVVPIEPIGPETKWYEALEGIDTVVHLAARVHVMDEKDDDPLKAYRHANVYGTEHLAREAANHGIKRFVFLSSVKVLGEETEVPYCENAPPQPMDPYGISKHEAEDALWKVAAETDLEVVIIRPPLVYGAGVKANFLNLLKLVHLGIPMPLGAVNNCRSLIYRSNLIDAIVICINHPKAVGQTFLVSDNEDVSTPELIRRVASAMGCPARLFPVPVSVMRFAGKLTGKTAAMDRLLGSLVVDSGKIRRELGWNPPFTMAEGLKETAEWYKVRLGTMGDKVG